MTETKRPLKVFLCHADRDRVRALPQGPSHQRWRGRVARQRKTLVIENGKVDLSVTFPRTSFLQSQVMLESRSRQYPKLFLR